MTRLAVNRKLSDLRSARDRHAVSATSLAVSEARMHALQSARALCQCVAESVQASTHKQVAGLVRRCLDAVFGSGAFGFDIRFEQKRGRTEAKLLFTHDGNEIDPVEAGSGGAMEVAAFALRLACLTLSTPQPRRLLVLDEPFKAVSQDNLPAVRELLEALAADTGTQILMVSHHEALRTGTVVTL